MGAVVSTHVVAPALDVPLVNIEKNVLLSQRQNGCGKLLELCGQPIHLFSLLGQHFRVLGLRLAGQFIAALSELANVRD